MCEILMSLVTGAPAAGKKTLSKNLDKHFDIPVINKDEIKEIIFDSPGIKDNE